MLKATSNFALTHHVSKLLELVDAGMATPIDITALEHFMDDDPTLVVLGYEEMLEDELDAEREDVYA